MNKELEKTVEKGLKNFMQKLADNPDEVFDNHKLQIKYNNLLKEKIKKDKEIERLNNIINELEKWLNGAKIGDISFSYIHTLDKLKELKEGNK